jgi:KilA-N domain
MSNMNKTLKITPHLVNGISIDQRHVDGYVNGTAMCVAHGKDISDWLKTDDTLELVLALADDLRLDAKPHKSGNSVYTRVSATFPSLVMVKRGSPETGGGTWLHPDLAVQLAQWCNKPFAIKVGRWVRNWFHSVYNPIQLEADADRVRMRDKLKASKRLAFTDQVKAFLEAADQYRPGSPHTISMFVRCHDALNVILTTETSDQMRRRLSAQMGRPISDQELLRDYFPIDALADFGNLCQAAANEMNRNGTDPLKSIQIAAQQVLSPDYVAHPINFVERIDLVRRRLMERDQLLLASV